MITLRALAADSASLLYCVPLGRHGDHMVLGFRVRRRLQFQHVTEETRNEYRRPWALCPQRRMDSGSHSGGSEPETPIETLNRNTFCATGLKSSQMFTPTILTEAWHAVHEHSCHHLSPIAQHTHAARAYTCDIHLLDTISYKHTLLWTFQQEDDKSHTKPAQSPKPQSQRSSPKP